MKETGKGFPPLHRKLEPVGSRIDQVLLPLGMQPLEQGVFLMVLGCENVVALPYCKEALLCTMGGGAFLACSEVSAYKRVLVLSGTSAWERACIWVSACNEASVCSAVSACNVVLVYTSLEDETQV